jgi:hypothetical protein
MTERLLIEGKLGELLKKIADVRDPSEVGCYMLYARDDLLDENSWCAIILSFHEEDEDFVPQVAEEKNLYPLAILTQVQSVIRVAYRDKPQANSAELVKALNYYLDNDAFLDLS